MSAKHENSKLSRDACSMRLGQAAQWYLQALLHSLARQEDQWPGGTRLPTHPFASCRHESGTLSEYGEMKRESKIARERGQCEAMWPIFNTT
jgi:hypothetical protein